MRVRCPHCQNPIELLDDSALDDVTCDTCGSSFSLVGTEATAPYSQAANETLGHFTLRERLGIGAFGSVWKAHDTELDRTVAVKIPRKDQLDAAEAEKFLREARAAAQLKHPNIVGVHEVGRQDETIYIVSELIDGLTLTDWLSAALPPPQEATELCIKVALALHHAHEQGVIHRDLKPSNIMLDRDGQPHIMDFGLAKREAGEITMTVDGQVLGTPAYMSPEQARGEGHAADRRTDVYSLGVILFELLTGERPFRGNQRMLLHQLLTEDPPSPRKLNSAVPRDLETICLKCLRRDPDRRYSTCAAVADDLKRWLEGQAIVARPVGRLERAWLWTKRRPAIAALSSLLLLAMLLGTTISTYLAIGYQSALTDVESEYNRAEDALEKVRASIDRYVDIVENEELLKDPRFKDLIPKLLAEALTQYEQYIERHADSQDAETRSEVGLALRRIARIHQSSGDPQQAAVCHERAREVQEQLVAEHPDTISYLVDLSGTLNDLGVLLHESGDIEEARRKYEQGLRVKRRITEAQPDNDAYQQTLSFTLNNLGSLADDLGEASEALSYYEQALAIQTRNHERYPRNHTYSFDLAKTLNLIAIVHGFQRNNQAGIDAHERGIAIHQEALEVHPDDPRHRAY